MKDNDKRTPHQMEWNITGKSPQPPKTEIDTPSMQPRFQLAKTRLPLLRTVSQIGFYLVAVIAFGLLISYLFCEPSLWQPLLGNHAAALLLLTMALKLASQRDTWRLTQLDDSNTDVIIASDIAEQGCALNESGDLKNEGASLSETEIMQSFKSTFIRYTNIDVICVLLLCSLTLLCIYLGWYSQLSPIAASKSSYALAGFLVICAFALLVAERYLFLVSKADWPEAKVIGFMVRLLIFVLLCSSALLFMLDENRSWPLQLLVYVGFLPMFVAIELIIRAVAAYFTSARLPSEHSLIGKSLIVTLLNFPPRPINALQYELHQHFGIDLQQVWAFSFLKKVFFPMVIAILLIGWLLSSVTVIPLNQRGIYEKFGKPVCVLQSGLHVGLPWPFGKVIAVEYGVIHEVAMSEVAMSDVTMSTVIMPAESVIAANETARYANRQINDNGAEVNWRSGYAPESANRLWDFTHRNEKSQLIASKINDKQSFHILNMDVRAIYRIGLSDKQALDAIYSNKDNRALIQNLLERILVHDFSSRTLDDALVAQRDKLSVDVMGKLQQHLDELNAGIDILAVVIEAIHPPSGAANAYHSVQAAQITTQVLIAKEQAKAIEQKRDAQIQSLNLTNKSRADAKESVAKAKTDLVRFTTEQSAWKTAGNAFVMEYYFNQLSRVLTSVKPPLLIIDHRITINSRPTIDWRSYLPPTVLKIKGE